MKILGNWPTAAVLRCDPYSCVLILSNGVTASSDSVIPAPNPATTVLGPETLPSASSRSDLYASNATKRIPAFSELPMIKVVHPAYHCRPNGGHGSFLESGNRRLSCVRVFANSAGYVIAISTAPAVEPAMIERSALGLGLGLGVMSSGVAVAWVGIADMLCRELHRKSQLLRWQDVGSLGANRSFVRAFTQS
jgi:hypothetical protein